MRYLSLAILATVNLLILAATGNTSVANAETDAQYSSALVRARAFTTARMQKWNAVPDEHGNRAYYTVYHTPVNGTTVTMRFRARFHLPTDSAALPDWIVCRGRITVRGSAVNDRTRLRAALAEDSCSGG